MKTIFKVLLGGGVGYVIYRGAKAFYEKISNTKLPSILPMDSILPQDLTNTLTEGPSDLISMFKENLNPAAVKSWSKSLEKTFSNSDITTKNTLGPLLNITKTSKAAPKISVPKITVPKIKTPKIKKPKIKIKKLF